MSDTLEHRPAEPGGSGPAVREIGLASNPVRLLLLVGAFVALGVVFGLGVPLVLGAIVVSIFLHEAGHYLAARATGMKATEFFIGFGPKLWSFRRGETEYGVKLIWLGAYVKIIGMNNLEEVPEADEPRTYRQQSYPKRVLVAFAGPAMNLLLALVLLFGLFTVVGTERSAFPEVGVLDSSAAAEAGLRTGDEIVSVDGEPVEAFDDLRSAILDRGGEDVELVVRRDGEERTFVATLGERTLRDGSSVGFLGVRPGSETVREGPLTAAVSTGKTFGHWTYQSVAGLVRFFSPSGLSDFAEQVASTPPSGGGDAPGDAPASMPDAAPAPAAGADDTVDDGNRVISILGIVQIGRHLDLANVVALMAALNIFLALFNLIPLLPFDGGHIAVATYERLRSRHGERYVADYAKLIPVTYVVVAIIVSVGLGAIYLDAVNPVAVPN